MRYTSFICALLLIVGIADRSDACQIAFLRRGLPSQVPARAVGVVSGYGVASRPVADVENATTLLVRVDEVVSGKITTGDTQVVLLFYDPGCRSTPTDRGELERIYPVGSSVVVSGLATSVSEPSPTPAIVAEMNHGGFVARIPGNVVRTTEGDLDFQTLDPAGVGRIWPFVEFEFDRAVLALPQSPKTEHFARLRNLANYPGFPLIGTARQLFGELVFQSGVSAEERQALLDMFDEFLRTAFKR